MIVGYSGKLGREKAIEDLHYRLSKCTDSTVELKAEELEVVFDLFDVLELHLYQERQHEDEIAEIENAQEHIDWERAEELNAIKEQLVIKNEEIKNLKKERATLKGKVTRLEKKVANLQ